MKAKARVSLYVCTNATKTIKLPMSIIGTAKNPRCFRKGSPPVTYFSHKNAWSDSVTFKKWFYGVFLPFIRAKTSEKVLVIMDNCGPHGADLVDNRDQVTIMTLPPNCTSLFQPMDMGVIAALKLKYKPRLLERISLLIDHRSALRQEARRLPASLKGLDEGHSPHMSDVCEMIYEAWKDISEKTVARCWVKADILPRGVQAAPEATHGKVSRNIDPKDEADISEISANLSKLQLMNQHEIARNLQEVGEKDILKWIEIEDDYEVREALVNDMFEAVEQRAPAVLGPQGGAESFEAQESDESVG